MNYCPGSHIDIITENKICKKLILCIQIDILVVGMHVQNTLKVLVFLILTAFLSGCDAMDDLFIPSDTYKVSAQVNNVSLDECSFVSRNGKIRPYFEKPVSNDPDVTSLLVFMKNSKGDVIGPKVMYSLNGGAEQDELLVTVKSLDDELPFFPMPENLPFDYYTLVSQVMSGRDVLQKIEKPFYYMGNTFFSFEGISVHLPGVNENPLLISKEMTVMLEAKLNFKGRMNPYIIWYNGKRKISEGKYSNGAGNLLWKASEQSGFYSIRAEVFPVENHYGLAGYQKEISLLVSAKTVDLNLVSRDIPQLLQWHVFEGNLNDLKKLNSTEKYQKPVVNGALQWMPSNGIYGLATGDNSITLPKVAINEISYNEALVHRGMWQTLFRFKPLNEGVIFSVLFESSPDTSLVVTKDGQNLVLTLASPSKTVSQTVKITEHNSFITAGVSFSIFSGLLAAKINIMGDSVEQGYLAMDPIRIETNVKNNFQILLGIKSENVAGVNSIGMDRSFSTALWDEFALYDRPPMEILAADIKKSMELNRSELDIASVN
jgi:hypothetical protein